MGRRGLILLMLFCLPLVGTGFVPFNPRDVSRDFFILWIIKDTDIGDDRVFVFCRPVDANIDAGVGDQLRCPVTQPFRLERFGFMAQEGYTMTGDCTFTIYSDGVAQSNSTIKVGAGQDTNDCEHVVDPGADGIDADGDACVRELIPAIGIAPGTEIQVKVFDGVQACDVIDSGIVFLSGEWGS